MTWLALHLFHMNWFVLFDPSHKNHMQIYYFDQFILSKRLYSVDNKPSCKCCERKSEWWEINGIFVNTLHSFFVLCQFSTNSTHYICRIVRRSQLWTFQVHMEIRWVEQEKPVDFVYILSDGYLFYGEATCEPAVRIWWVSICCNCGMKEPHLLKWYLSANNNYRICNCSKLTVFATSTSYYKFHMILGRFRL